MGIINSTTITFDLSSLELPTGTYSIYVKLSRDGYQDSEASNIVEYTVGGSSANLISFTIDGTAYQAEDGMTWEQWVESSYNTDGYRLRIGHSVASSNGWYVIDEEGTLEFPTDTISNGVDYALQDPSN